MRDEPLAADAVAKMHLWRIGCALRRTRGIYRLMYAYEAAYRTKVRRRGLITFDDIPRLIASLGEGRLAPLEYRSGMTGCYQPCHNCIDNCIHTYAGIQLRNYCQQMMDEQGYEEPTGQAKITPGFNLPCRYVLHTVGPIVQGKLTELHEQQLASCYRSCLRLADEYSLTSIAFCCISTGVFMFPNRRAAEIAVQTVRDYKKSENSRIKVIFNVWKDIDYEIYRQLLG